MYIDYIDRVPNPPLDAFVASIWFCQGSPRPHTLERVLPFGAAQLIVNLKEDQTRVYRPESGFRCETSSGTILAGIQSRYSVIDTAEQECVLGVSFKPDGTTPFFRVPAHEARDADMPLELLWGRCRATDLREQLLEAPTPHAKIGVMERTLAAMCRLPGPDRVVTFAVDAFTRDCDVRIAAVADKTGLSPKRFIERFKTAVGLSPKRYCRVLRFQKVLARANGDARVDWTRVAMDCGYFDQAHFIHDFRAFAGLTPTGYQAARTEFQNHVKFLQSDTGVVMR